MKKINNIGTEGFQTHTIPLDTGDITLQIRFYASVEIWQMSVEYQDKSINGVKLSAGVTHIRSANLPFDFILEDTTGNGIDPYKQDDFSTERCILYLLDADETEAIRGQAVG
jgi:hypothetical protein